MNKEDRCADVPDATDEGTTWTEASTVWDGRAAYSDQVVLPDNELLP